MRKSFKGILSACLLFAAAAFGVNAQTPQLPQLPQDSALVTGVLPNGLTYYIRHNETPKGQADFYIAQKVGSILEEEDQRGLAHFLEHMCFNGTQNFPEKQIINWLESVGVKFGRNLNAYTSIDETVYNISSVPVARTSVQDSCLLILHDWANALTLAPEEIDAERGVIHEEWRQSMVGSMRILERLLPQVYPNSRYGERLPIGLMSVVDNFPYQALIDYYHKWYRPDQQAIIVVGDIEPAYIEEKIKEIFTPIPMPENAAERVYFEVEDTPGTIYAVGSDPEMQQAVAMMFFKSDDIIVPAEMRNTQAFFVYSYMQNMIDAMLNTRLDDLAKNPDCKYAQAYVSCGEFFVSRTKGALSMQVVAKGADLLSAFGEAYREILRADQSGFTLGELERARQEFLSRIDRLYQERDSRETDSYSREYVRLFTQGDPAPGIAVEKQMYDQIAQMVGIELINQYFQSLVNDDNRVVIAMLPAKEGYSEPTDEQFEELVDQIDNEDLEPYRDEVREDPLIPALRPAGTIVSNRELPEWGAVEYTLSNGAKVVVKKTGFKANQILFQALALGGGESTLDQSKAASIMFTPYALSNSGLNDYSNSDLQKYLAGKQVEVDFSYDDYTRELEGNSTVADLPTLMELIYSTFTGINLNETEYNAFQGNVASMLANQESNPQFKFLQFVKSILTKAASQQAITSEDVQAASREDILANVHGMLSNAADYTFYFVGDINTETLLPLVEQYIASLPGDAANATTSFTHNPDFEVATGSGYHEATAAMETPQSWVFIEFCGTMPYTAKNKALATVAAQILSKRLLDKVREEMGATYSIGANGSLQRAAQNNCIFQIAFPMKPEFRQETLPIIKDMVNAMTSTVTADELRPAVEYLVKTARENLEKNESWISAMVATQINGVQTFTNAEETASSITTEDVQNFMQQLLDQHNYREIVLDPEGFNFEATE